MSMENAMSKLEARFDEWLLKFEQQPISTGVKAIVVILILRLIWRSFR